MIYPKIIKKNSGRVNKVSDKILSVDGFDGGVNFDKNHSLIADNQLAEVNNMWWEGNLLKSRPGFRLSGSSMFSGYHSGSAMTPTNKRYYGEQKRTIVRSFDSYNGGEISRSIVAFGKDLSDSEDENVIVDWTDQYDAHSYCYIENRGGESRRAGIDESLLFVGGGYDNARSRFYSKRGSYGWEEATHTAYAPLVFMEGKGSASTGEPSISGKAGEDYNVLTPKFRAQFTSQGGVNTYFYLPVKKIDNSEITINYTNASGLGAIYTIAAASSSSNLINNIRFTMNRAGGYFFAVNQSGVTITLPSSGIINNIEFSGSKTFSGSGENAKVVSGMRYSMWFGGDRSDGTSGVRLFLAGNDEYPGRIQWSAAANDLYFPCSNFTYVGEAGQKITALAKQDNRLIVFKEDEIYTIGYSGQSRSNNRVQFPVNQICPDVGCDCPQSIQLCNGRLVWLNSKKVVYTLSGVGSGAKAVELSRNIAPWFACKTEKQMISSVSTVYKGNYFLLVSNEMFVMSFDKKKHEAYSRRLISSDSDDISWYKWDWDFGFTTDFLLCDNDKFMVGGYKKVGLTHTILFTGFLDGNYDDYIVLNSSVNDGFVVQKKDISLNMKSKNFDFGDIKCYKNLRSVWFEISSENSEFDVHNIDIAIVANGESISLDSRDFSGGLYEDAGAGASGGAGAGMNIYRCDVHLSRISTAGISISCKKCDKALKVGRIIFDYDIYNRVRG